MVHSMGHWLLFLFLCGAPLDESRNGPAIKRTKGHLSTARRGLLCTLSKNGSWNLRKWAVHKLRDSHTCEECDTKTIVHSEFLRWAPSHVHKGFCNQESGQVLRISSGTARSELIVKI